jgi:hypothetical protein
MTCRRAIEQREMKAGNCEVIPQVVWPIAKSFMKRGGPKAKTTIHGLLGITYCLNKKSNVIAEFTSHDLCDKNHERQTETRVQAVLVSVDKTPLGRVRPCDIHKLANSLKLRRACGLDGIPNECLRRLPKRLLLHLTHLFNHCLRLSHFPKPGREAKVTTLPKPGMDPKFPQNLWLISLLFTAGKLFEKVILKIFQRHDEERGLLNASQFGFHAHHSTTLHYMRFTDHVTLNFSNNIAAVFLDIEKAFDTHGTLACYINYLYYNFRSV